MIRAVMVMNTQGKPRLAKFYDYQPVEKQQELIRSIFGVEQRTLATSLKLMQSLAWYVPFQHAHTFFVETLDKCFKNVCELDIVFNFNKMHTILDEIVLGGQVLETSSAEVMKAVGEITKMEWSSDATVLIPKSVSSRLGR
ncbi:AP-3 complex subunit sigma isoform X2 [Magnolia sinica]|uniref:AP-3 complex subunit sigma isoform X2 n=1 Tax=Magnolia sinica TaxID=86752 RepID=UPI00265A08EB|nr:AP-3 complex subunit sigma isoform X2 [Magnolia sinica]